MNEKTSFLYIKSFIDKIGRDKLYSYSATAAFFMILSIFPFVILLLTLVKYTPLTEPFLIEQMQKILPGVIYPLIVQIIEEIYNTSLGKGVLTISVLFTIWSASKGVMAIIRGTNVAFNINDRRNYFRVRLLSCLYTVVVVIVFAFVLLLMVFGKALYQTLKDQHSFLYNILKFVLQQRIVISLVILTLVFMMIYKFLPARQNLFWPMLPGALICAGAWLVLSGIASIYIKRFPNFTYTYGSLTSFILMMLLMYFYMYTMFICAELNFFFSSWLENSSMKRQRKRAVKYDNKIEQKQIKVEMKQELKQSKKALKQKK